MSGSQSSRRDHERGEQGAGEKPVKGGSILASAALPRSLRRGRGGRVSHSRPRSLPLRNWFAEDDEEVT